MGPVHDLAPFLLLILYLTTSFLKAQPGKSSTFEIRLDGPSPYEGRVEVRRNSSEPWGSICYYDWKKTETAVVCRQLNMGYGRELVSVPPRGRPLYMDNLSCRGTESSLASCSYGHWKVRSCSHGYVTVVHCRPLYCSGAEKPGQYCNPSKSEDVEVRLVGGPNETEGIVEVRLKNSRWGTLCHKHVFGVGDVVCRQLNLGNSGEYVQVNESSQYRRNATTTYWNDFDCLGFEKNLGQCSHMGWGYHVCGQYAPVAIRCRPEDVQVRLVGGPSDREGILEAQGKNGDWGTVCDDHFDDRTIGVVCRHLNLGDNGQKTASSAYTKNATIKFMTQIDCIGSERNLAHCGLGRSWIVDSCFPLNLVAIRCGPQANAPRPLPEPDKTDSLQNLTKSEVTRDTVAGVKDVLQQQGQTSAADVVLVANFLDRASQLTNMSTQVATDLLKIVDTVAELNQSVLQQSNSVGNTTNRLIAAVEQLADRVSLEEGQAFLQTNSTVLQVWNLTSVPPSPFLGLQLSSEGDSQNVTSVTNLSDSATYTRLDTAIFLPGHIGLNITQKNSGRDVRLSASVIQQTGLFQADSHTDSHTDSQDTDSQDTDTSQAPTAGKGSSGGVSLDSKVMSLRISVDGQPVSDLSSFGQGNVTIVFTPLQPISEKAAAAAAADPGAEGAGRQCVFWDFALRQGRGGWSGRGCYLEDIVEGKVVCVCDHLTNFAIIMDLRGQREEMDIVHERVLGLISMVGLILSIGGLFLTLLAFLLVKKLHKSLPQQTLFNMALSMLLSWLTFLVGIQRVESHVACVAVAMLLHYFILVSFLWMLAQGILQFFMLVKVRTRPFTRYMLKAGLLAGVSLPVLPVIVVSAVDVELYRGGQTYCWMSQTPFYYAFLAPVAVIVATNVVIYVLVVVSICRRPNIGIGSDNYTAVSVRASIICFVVLGLSWVFAFFALGDARLVFQYLFTCTTAFQGFLIFVLYTARDPAVRAFLHNVRARRGSMTTGAEKPGDTPPGAQLRIRSTRETSFSGSK